MTDQKQEALVINFPTNRIVRQVPDEVVETRKKKTLEVQTKEEAGEMTQELLRFFVEEKEAQANESFQRDFSYLAEVMEATLFRTRGLEHEFHKFIDDHVEIVEEPPESIVDPNTGAEMIVKPTRAKVRLPKEYEPVNDSN